MMFHNRCDPRLGLQSQGGNPLCINAAPVSLRAIAPCGTYRLRDTLKTAQMSAAVIVLEQLTHGGRRE